MLDVTGSSGSPATSPDQQFGVAAPQIALPKGGGALHGIGEKFAANPGTGTGTLTVPIAVSPGRAGFAPQLALSYDSGAGNGPFGLGWSLSLPAITRRTDKGLPRYHDADESDVFILSGAEDLVPVLEEVQGNWQRPQPAIRDGYSVSCYRPRIEGLFSVIERWTRAIDGDTYWRSISRDNVTTFYGKTPESRIADPDDPSRIFSWLISQTYDDKGNAAIYRYAAENDENVDRGQANERNRARTANRYLKRVKYGNRTPNRDLATWQAIDPSQLPDDTWMFQVLFDYDEGHYEELDLDPTRPEAAQHRFVRANAPPELVWNSPERHWSVRPDPVSSYRSCFEVRTYRLCRRVLMFHHFPDELGTLDYLVRATEFAYRETPIASFVTAVTQSGFVRQPNGTYLKRSLPPLEFEYNQAQVQQDVREVDPDSLANLPSSVDGTSYRWLDLDGEGLQCVLAENGDGWIYKRNVSPLTFDFVAGAPTSSVRFEAANEVARLPGFAEAGAPHQFLDLAGDGQLDCVVLQRPAAGFYQRTQDEDWEPFTPLPSSPNVDWNDPNLRFIDLDGDGHADVLITEHEAITWYPSLAENGFGAPVRLSKARDEEEGPAIVFAEGTQSIFLADMSGGGLTDIVRIRNGEVCYWPNLGYGRFGRKVTMDNAPWFDSPDRFDPTRIRLADIDGSGTTDIIYVGGDGIQLHFNQAGNSFAAPEHVTAFPPVDNLETVQALDLLGNGTACLVWMSSLPGDARHSMRYVDLMGGEKPHLLTHSRNNLGAETRVFYAPSTKFYLADRAAGQPWATRLPFPVHVVERVETCDWVSRNRFVTRYAYHHGYFDGIEREFRGFGMVEQLDTEELGALSQNGTFPDATNIDAASYVPPVCTKTWFHTGAYPQGPRVTRVYDGEYWRESDLAEGVPGLTDDEFAAMLLPDTVLPADLGGDEVREAIRSLKGAILRQELYALDGTEAADRPYSVAERNYTIRRLQPFGPNRHAVFFTHARESIDFHYERKLYDVNGRKLADPRVSHNMVLAVDDYGNALQSVAIGYSRRHDDPDPVRTDADRAEQKTIHVTLTENVYTNPIPATPMPAADAYRTPLPAETRTYELINVTPEATTADVTNLFTFEVLAGTPNSQGKIAEAAMHDLPYEDVYATGIAKGQASRRLIEHVRTIYREDDLSGGLQLGAPKSLESRALVYEHYKLALVPGLSPLFQRGSENLLPGPVSILREGGYVLGDDLRAAGLFPAADPDGRWWIPSGRIFCSPAQTDTAVQELANAQAHFFLPRRFRDPFGNEGTVAYDGHDLLLLEVADAVQNKVTVGERADDGSIANGNDYRVLQPALLTDANGNRSAVAFDALSLVAGTAVRGKRTESLGDALDGFQPDLTQQDVDQFLADLKGAPASALLGNATSRIVYDLGRLARAPSTPADPRPICAGTIVRETHMSDLGQDQTSKLQVSISYSDGFGREIQRKIQAESGPLVATDPPGPIVDPRWVASGWTVFNNKGKPVRKYEPFFTDTTEFQFGVKVGVSPILFYDPVERIVATLHPDHAFEKVVFDPWRQESWDANDTVLLDPKTDADVGAFFQRIPDVDYLPTWYAAGIGEAPASPRRDAAEKAAKHAGTPAVAFFDTLGRTFLTLAFNRYEANGAPVESRDRTLVEFDIEGNQRSLTDALGRKIMVHDYDMLGTRIRQQSVDAGTRWMLNDVAGKLLRAWDSRGRAFRTEYDPVRRPLRSFVRGADPQDLSKEILYGRTEYGEGQTDDRILNLRGKIFRQFDGAGVVTNVRFDFRGNLLSSTRQLLQNYKDAADWSQSPVLESETFASSSGFDALNRPIQLIAPKSSNATLSDIIQPVYNEANLLERIDGWLAQPASPQGLLDPSTASFHPVTNIDHDTKGQRTLIEYGNGASTTFEYDPETFQLVHLVTTRKSDAAKLQDLSYTYDPVGNITQINDAAQQTIYFNNQVVPPSADYTYDAIYRLIQASGREHIGQAAAVQVTEDDFPRMNLPLPTDGTAMRTYTETYRYDAVGNIQALIHAAGSNGSWTRDHAYDAAGNRLLSTTIAGLTAAYSYDAAGNMTSMSHLTMMAWDYRDRLSATSRQAVNDTPPPKKVPETTFYLYDGSGQRVRKVTERQNGARKNERIYLGLFEMYREYGGNGTDVSLQRETLHITDDKQRIALVETKTIDANVPDNALPSTTMRYQLANHLGSAMLELDEAAATVSYEEYYPYGSTSYQAGRSGAETSLKRYRFTGKERDDENGLYYHGARYYAPWLGRWISVDPGGLADNVDPYVYARSNPSVFFDPNGYWSVSGVFDEVKQAAVMVGDEITQGTVSAVTNFHQTVKETGEAMADVVYAAAHPTEKEPIKVAIRAAEAINGIVKIATVVGAAAHHAKQEDPHQNTPPPPANSSLPAPKDSSGKDIPSNDSPQGTAQPGNGPPPTDSPQGTAQPGNDPPPTDAPQGTTVPPQSPSPPPSSTTPPPPKVSPNKAPQPIEWTDPWKEPSQWSDTANKNSYKSTATQYLYEIVSKEGDVLKYGTSFDPPNCYTKAQMAAFGEGAEMKLITQGDVRRIREVERNLIDNYEAIRGGGRPPFNKARH